MRLTDKVAVITGASRGIGAAIATAFCQEGAKVLLNYRSNDAAAKDMYQNLVEIYSSQNVSLYKADVSHRQEVKAMFDYAYEHFGTIDILVNNAGINQRGYFHEITDEQWDDIMRVNLKAPFICCQEVFPFFITKGQGRIVNISSVAGQYHGPKTVHYAVSKAGLNSLTKVVARYGAEHNILVNAVAPGIIRTDQTADEIDSLAGKKVIDLTLLKKAGRFEDVTSACIMLCSDEQQYMTGQVLAVSGGAILGN